MNNPALKFLYLVWFLPVFIILTVILGTACVVVSFFSARAARFISNTLWGRAALDPAGIRLAVSGRENLPTSEGGFIIFANHTSAADIPAVALSTGRSITWVAKAALGRIPFFGWSLMRVHMLVDRGGGADSARKMVTEAETRLRRGEILAIFPEGTRNKTDQPVLPFKKGAFILAKHTGAPIVPLAIKNAGRLWPAGTFRPRPGTIKVRIGPPLIPEPGEKLGDITARAQAAMEKLLLDDSW